MERLYLFLAIVLGTTVFCNAEIKLTNNNGYEGITIVVQENQKQHEDFIPALKELLQNASKYMYQATNGLAYFGNVSVVVPSHWNLTNEKITIVDSPIPISSADIRVAQINGLNILLPKAHVEARVFSYVFLAANLLKLGDYGYLHIPNPKYMNEPYTLQPGACGEPGKYIHITKDFILNENGTMQMDYGTDLGREIVHEWAHYRYGVFDEFGEPGSKLFPPFYLDGNDVRPVACGEDIPGDIENVDGSECFYEHLNDACIFRPSESEVNIASSIMYFPYIPSITQFCDDTTANAHNMKAPSPQNIKCSYTPTWTVIQSHKDFNAVKSRQPLKDLFIQILQPIVLAEPRFVVVMDISGSMDDSDDNVNTRLTYLTLVVKRFLSSMVPDNSKVGLVTFSTAASISSYLTRINSISRKKLSNMLPEQTEGSTCIGCGLRKAIEVLSSHGQNPAGGTIILITDGDNTQSPDIYEVMDEVLSAKVVVNTIAIGLAASQNLHLVSKKTGGNNFYFSGKQKDLSKFDQAFVVSVHRQKDVETTGIQYYMMVTDFIYPTFQLYMNSTSLSGYQVALYDVYIDQSLGNDTKFTVSDSKGLVNWVKFNIISPDNHTYTESDISIFKYDHVTFTKTFTFDTAMAGKWKISFKNENNHIASIDFTVTSKKKNKDSTPISVRCWLSNTDVDLSKSTNVIIFCHVLKGYDAVIKATVNAAVRDPDGNVFNINLLDDGSGADTEVDDGIYSTYFTNFQSNNRYTIVGTVLNDGKAKVLKGTKASTAPKRISGSMQGKPATKFSLTSLRRAPPGYVSKKPKTISKAAEIFQRSVTVDSFMVKNINQFNKKSVPPSRVSDLTVLQSEKSPPGQYNHVTFKLRWTSVGDDLDVGQAKSLDIRYSLNHSEILKNFDQAKRITKFDLRSGTLKPLKPHKIQTLDGHLNITVKGLSLYFALKTVDHEGNSAPLSNIAEATFVNISMIPQFIPSTFTEEITTVETTSEETTEEHTTTEEITTVETTPEETTAEETATEKTTEYGTTPEEPTSTEILLTSEVLSKFTQEESSTDMFTEETTVSSTLSNNVQSKQNDHHGTKHSKVPFLIVGIAVGCGLPMNINEMLTLLEDDNTPANIYIEPVDGELTDEDSADEDEGGAIDNLSSNPGY
ncbi:Calcium-activated chloride channel regulator 3A-1 [Nymphon striatum]|nr:Calcium-activated chloride channel regulator 3A-1 [Nymphon striatum]